LSIFGIAGIKISNTTQKVIGYFMGLAAVFLLLDDLRGSFPDGVVDNLANLTFYAGAVLMFLGARGLKD
jgi:hypothetical protein